MEAYLIYYFNDYQLIDDSIKFDRGFIDDGIDVIRKNFPREKA